MTSSNERRKYALPRGAKMFLNGNPEAVRLLAAVYARNGAWVNAKELIIELGIPEERWRHVYRTMLRLYDSGLVFSEFHNPEYPSCHHRIRRYRSIDTRSEQVHWYLSSAGGDTT